MATKATAGWVAVEGNTYFIGDNKDDVVRVSGQPNAAPLSDSTVRAIGNHIRAIEKRGSDVVLLGRFAR